MATALNRWQPSNGLSQRDALDRLFDTSFVRPFGTFGFNDGIKQLPLDLYENDDAFIVRAFVPGVTPDNLDITAQGTTLTIRAQQPVEHQEGVHYILRERVGNRWFRSVELPSDFDADKVEAKLENGVLFITLPKTPEAKPHKISITTS